MILLETQKIKSSHFFQKCNWTLMCLMSSQIRAQLPGENGMAKGGSMEVAGVPAGRAHNQRERETRSQEEGKIKVTHFRCHARKAWSLAQGQQMPQKTSKCQVPTSNGQKKNKKSN